MTIRAIAAAVATCIHRITVETARDPFSGGALLRDAAIVCTMRSPEPWPGPHRPAMARC
ncbi:hypothetical protein GCM10027411_19280 [Microbacterium aureliae]